jgi:hypothetical protein
MKHRLGWSRHRLSLTDRRVTAARRTLDELWEMGDAAKRITIRSSPASCSPNVRRPKLVGKVADMDPSEAVCLGYPNWWSTMPMAVFAFLEGHDLAGKKIGLR